MSDDLLEAVRQWMLKAFSDWTAVEILTEDPRCPRSAACFHCQQYVEKLLKAYLTLNGVEAPRTHDLRLLITLCEPTLPSIAALKDRADELSIHGVQSRYPGAMADVSDRDLQRMLALVDDFVAVLLPALPKVNVDAE